MKPLVLKAAEVRALLDGVTQLRIPINGGTIKMVNPGQPNFVPPREMLAQAFTDVVGMRRTEGNLFTWQGKAYAYQGPGKTRWMARPIWDLGENLWVRERWFDNFQLDTVPQLVTLPDGTTRIYFEADGPHDFDSDGQPKYRSAMTMPRWASRLTISVVSIEAEQDADGWVWVLDVARVEEVPS